MSTEGKFMTRNVYFSVLRVFFNCIMNMSQPRTNTIPPSGTRRTAVGEHVRTLCPPPAPGARAVCWARACCPRAARPARRSARAARTAPPSERLRPGGERLQGRPAAPHQRQHLRALRRARAQTGSAPGCDQRRSVREDGNRPARYGPALPGCRSCHRAQAKLATRDPSQHRAPALGTAAPPAPSPSRPGHRHRPRGSAQASPRSRRDGRVGVGCGRCCGRPRQRGAGGCPAAAASHAFTATKSALSSGGRRRAPGCASTVPARRAPGDDGEEGRSLRTSLR